MICDTPPITHSHLDPALPVVPVVVPGALLIVHAGCLQLPPCIDFLRDPILGAQESISRSLKQQVGRPRRYNERGPFLGSEICTLLYHYCCWCTTVVVPRCRKSRLSRGCGLHLEFRGIECGSITSCPREYTALGYYQ